MNRQEIINHFADVVSAVFCAEDVVRPQWEERLRAARSLDEPAKQELAEAYRRAVAEEIISQYPEEELERLYGNETTN